VIDCAANPSVLAGLDARPNSLLASTGESPSLTLVDHNLLGTVHVLEYCKRHLAGLVLVRRDQFLLMHELVQYLPRPTLLIELVANDTPLGSTS
jgi:CDP-paratose 2-epimerase